MTTLLQDLQQAVGDTYRLDRELGGGGMSRVYLAEEVALGRQVVLKVLPPDLAAGLNAERFRREIQLAARLQHPHIVPVLAAGRAGDVLYYTMPLIEGESLRGKLARENELPVSDTVRLLRDVVDALTYAHERGVLHRDIKPDNVMVSRHHALVTDFGVAKALSEAAGTPGGAGVTSAGVAMGTPAYMAPEQAAADPTVDQRADIYAVGVMAYEMLAGHPPFAGRSPQQLLAAHVSRPPEPLGVVRPTVPPELAAVVMRCLEKRPADRWQTAEELLRALEGVVTPGGGSTATVAVRPSPAAGAAETPPTPRRSPWKGPVMAAGVTALALVGIALGLRAAGLLPGASLVERGVLRNRERIIISEFRSPPADSALGGAVTEAFRIDLGQSPTLTVVQPEYVQQVLQRMQRDPRATLDVSLAREVAIRDGIKALVAGDIAHAGGAFVISARLVSGASGEALVALRETAEDSSRILGAVDRLSREMRKRVGESLRSVQGREPLEQVTTGSLDALRKYSLAQSANREGDPERAISLLREAVALDSGFAMAYRKLGISIVNTGGRRSAQADAFTRAYQHRDRLTDRERYLTQAAYASYVLGDREQAITAYRSLLDVYPNDMVALNNLSIAYFELRNYAEAAELARRAIAASPEDWTMYANLVNAQWTMGQVDSAAATIRLMRSRTTGGGYTAEFDAQQATVRGDYDSATAILRGQRDARRDSPTVRTEISGQLAGLAALQGRLREADQYLQDAEDGQVARGLPEQALMAEVARAAIDIWYRGRTARGLRRTEAALQRRPLAAVDPIDRPYLALAIVYAEAGRPDRARALLAEFDRTASPGLRRMAETDRHGVLGTIALAERRPRDAIAEFRLQDQTSCPVCASANLGRAYDLAGEADSAIASYERYLSTPYTFRQFVDAIWLARTYVRLAELYEERHDRVKAADYYARFVRLWKNADPELQPKVLDAKRRLTSLTGEAPTT